jgi:hypothetical protein
VALTGEAKAAGVLLQDPGAAVVLQSARVDERQGGGVGCARRAPCEEKGGAGGNFWPGGSWCLFNDGAAWSSGGRYGGGTTRQGLEGRHSAARAARSAGSDPSAAGMGGRRLCARPAPNRRGAGADRWACYSPERRVVKMV